MCEWFLEKVVTGDTVADVINLEEKNVEYIIGRSRGHKVVCTGRHASRLHGVIKVDNDNIVHIKDTDSSNGIYINDIKIYSNQYQRLRENDIIGIGADSYMRTETKEFFKLRKKIIPPPEPQPGTSGVNQVSDQNPQDLNQSEVICLDSDSDEEPIPVSQKHGLNSNNIKPEPQSQLNEEPNQCIFIDSDSEDNPIKKEKEPPDNQNSKSTGKNKSNKHIFRVEDLNLDDDIFPSSQLQFKKATENKNEASTSKTEGSIKKENSLGKNNISEPDFDDIFPSSQLQFKIENSEKKVPEASTSKTGTELPVKQETKLPVKQDTSAKESEPEVESLNLDFDDDIIFMSQQLSPIRKEDSTRAQSSVKIESVKNVNIDVQPILVDNDNELIKMEISCKKEPLEDAFKELEAAIENDDDHDDENDDCMFQPSQLFDDSIIKQEDDQEELILKDEIKNEDDYDDYDYSIFNIKPEEDGLNREEDEPIILDDDLEEEKIAEKWYSRLSQNQGSFLYINDSDEDRDEKDENEDYNENAEVSECFGFKKIILKKERNHIDDIFDKEDDIDLANLQDAIHEIESRKDDNDENFVAKELGGELNLNGNVVAKETGANLISVENFITRLPSPNESFGEPQFLHKESTNDKEEPFGTKSDVRTSLLSKDSEFGANLVSGKKRVARDPDDSFGKPSFLHKKMPNDKDDRLRANSDPQTSLFSKESGESGANLVACDKFVARDSDNSFDKPPFLHKESINDKEEPLSTKSDPRTSCFSNELRANLIPEENFVARHSTESFRSPPLLVNETIINNEKILGRKSDLAMPVLTKESEAKLISDKKKIAKDPDESLGKPPFLHNKSTSETAERLGTNSDPKTAYFSKESESNLISGEKFVARDTPESFGKPPFLHNKTSNETEERLDTNSDLRTSHFSKKSEANLVFDEKIIAGVPDDSLVPGETPNDKEKTVKIVGVKSHITTSSTEDENLKDLSLGEKVVETDSRFEKDVTDSLTTDAKTVHAAEDRNETKIGHNLMRTKEPSFTFQKDSFDKKQSTDNDKDVQLTAKIVASAESETLPLKISEQKNSENLDKEQDVNDNFGTPKMNQSHIEHIPLGSHVGSPFLSKLSTPDFKNLKETDTFLNKDLIDKSYIKNILTAPNIHQSPLLDKLSTPDLKNLKKTDTFLNSEGVPEEIQREVNKLKAKFKNIEIEEGSSREKKRALGFDGNNSKMKENRIKKMFGKVDENSVKPVEKRPKLQLFEDSKFTEITNRSNDGTKASAEKQLDKSLYSEKKNLSSFNLNAFDDFIENLPCQSDDKIDSPKVDKNDPVLKEIAKIFESQIVDENIRKKNENIILKLKKVNESQSPKTPESSDSDSDSIFDELRSKIKKDHRHKSLDDTKFLKDLDQCKKIDREEKRLSVETNRSSNNSRIFEDEDETTEDYKNILGYKDVKVVLERVNLEEITKGPLESKLEEVEISVTKKLNKEINELLHKYDNAQNIRKKNKSKPGSEKRDRSPNSRKFDELSEKPAAKRPRVAEEKSKWPSVDYEEKSKRYSIDSEENSKRPNFDLEEKSKSSKSKYVVPPVIEAPFLKKGRRKAHEPSAENEKKLSKPKLTENLKRKISIEEKLSIPSKKLVAPAHSPSEKLIRQQFEKRSSHSKNKHQRSTSIDSETKQHIKEQRKEALKKLSEKNLDDKEKNHQDVKKCKSVAKVKTSDSRGLFLTADIEKEEPKEPPKKKFVIPKKKELTSPSVAHRSISMDSIEIAPCLKSPPVKHLNISVPKPTVPQLKSLLKTKSMLLEKTKKSVSFKPDASLVQVKLFDIEPGNKLKPCNLKDAPLIVGNNMNLNGCNKIQNRIPSNENAYVVTEEDSLHNVLSWNPNWLEEQKKMDKSPKVSQHRPMQMLHTFNTALDYFHIVNPLLLLELWTSVFECWKITRKVSVTGEIQTTGIIQRPNNIFFTKLECECLVTKKEIQENLYPGHGDLIIIEMVLNNPQNEIVTKFGYVVNLFRKKVNTQNIAMHRLAKFRKKHEVLDTSINYIIHLAGMSEKINTEKLVRIRAIFYLAPCLRILRSVAMLRFSPLCKFILKPDIDTFKVPPIEGINLVLTDDLNDGQQKSVLEATQICLRNDPGIYLLQGPPGTGKTVVILNLIRQLLYCEKGYKRNKKKILVCAPSNGAVDEITLRLLQLRMKFERSIRFKLLRVGPFNSIHPKVRDISIQKLSEKYLREKIEYNLNENVHLKEDLAFRESKINMLQNQLISCQDMDINRRELEQERIKKQLQKAKEDLEIFHSRNIKELSKAENFKHKRIAENELIENADVICTTLSSSTSRMEELYLNKKLNFACCIVDEATQSNEQETLLPLSLGIKRFVLVGDTAQLPATVLSQEAKDLGYGQSLFARIQKCLEHYPENPIRTLTTQYRMHAEIVKFPNQQFYEGKLITPPTLRRDGPFHPYIVFSLSLANPFSAESYVNLKEADFVISLTEIILKANTSMTIGIITPYSNQKTVLINKLDLFMKGMKTPRVDINTVDGFQGQERDVIIFSPVRFKTNGFLSDQQRLNVSFTRARYALYICAQDQLFKCGDEVKNSNTIKTKSDYLWQELSRDAILRKCYRFLTESEIKNIKVISDLVIKR